MRELVIYELHVGTFTPQGTFDAAIEHLPGLAELGITAIEVMPVAEFPGDRGWGYDGDLPVGHALAPTAGRTPSPRLVDAAHDAGLAVILDVVYNHVGASGTQALDAFGPYFTDKYETPWGRAMNYDDAECDPVREWVLQSADRLDPRLRDRRPAPRRDPRDLRLQRRAPGGRRWPAACTRRARTRW